MADTGREEKLAAARRKVRQRHRRFLLDREFIAVSSDVTLFSYRVFQLRKFQQKRTPSSSPAVTALKHPVVSSSIYSPDSSESVVNPPTVENNVSIACLSQVIIEIRCKLDVLIARVWYGVLVCNIA